jgi:hypothetical protein
MTGPAGASSTCRLAHPSARITQNRAILLRTSFDKLILRQAQDEGVESSDRTTW